ncbi:MAG: hypothetical protein ACLQUY_19210 [Ktedonobacterales bacterium]
MERLIRSIWEPAAVVAHAKAGLAVANGASYTAADTASGEGRGHTMDLLGDWNGATAALQPETTSIRCAICDRRSSGPMYRVVESDPPDDEPRSWMLCADCANAVRQEVERADLRTPLRVRIAVGIVALQRRRRPHFWNEQFWEELDDAAENRIMVWFIFGLLIFKTLFFVLVIAYVVAQAAH